MSDIYCGPMPEDPEWDVVPEGDPLSWNSDDVMSWLWHVFKEDNTDLHDLNYYIMHYMALWNERLTGYALSQMAYTNYIERWGLSGHTVFENFLLSLQRAGHAEFLLDMWRHVQVKSPSAGDSPPSLECTAAQLPPGETCPELPPTPDSLVQPLQFLSPISGDDRKVLPLVSPGSPQTLDCFLPPQDHMPPAETAFDFPDLNLPPFSSPVSSPPATSGEEEDVSSPTQFRQFYERGETERPPSSPESSDSGCDVKCRGRYSVLRRKKRVPLPPRPIFPKDMVLNLWEFLVELLNDQHSTYDGIIAWQDKDNGQFILKDTEVVAVLWGLQRKRKDMNYDKMSRALRYYYTRGVLSKVTSMRLAYKFELPEWRSYRCQATGYDTTLAGDESLASKGRMSRSSLVPESKQPAKPKATKRVKVAQTPPKSR